MKFVDWVRAILVHLGRWQPKALERGFACLNGANACSIRHDAGRARPECLANSP